MRALPCAGSLVSLLCMPVQGGYAACTDRCVVIIVFEVYSTLNMCPRTEGGQSMLLFNFVGREKKKKRKRLRGVSMNDHVASS